MMDSNTYVSTQSDLTDATNATNACCVSKANTATDCFTIVYAPCPATVVVDCDKRGKRRDVRLQDIRHDQVVGFREDRGPGHVHRLPVQRRNLRPQTRTHWERGAA